MLAWMPPRRLGTPWGPSRFQSASGNSIPSLWIRAHDKPAATPPGVLGFHHPWGNAQRAFGLRVIRMRHQANPVGGFNFAPKRPSVIPSAAASEVD